MNINTIDYQAYVDEMIDKLQSLVQIPSVLDPTTITEKTPYGQSIADALALVSQWAVEDCFQIRNYQGHAIKIESEYKNQSNQRIDLIAHLDVVGKGSNWTYPAFEGLIEENTMYGRGTVDMKRAVIVLYFVLRVIQDYQIPLKHRLCLILGTDEETNMEDLPYYLEEEGAPDFAVTPDGSFPLGIGEKGATTWLMQGELDDASVIQQMIGGEGANSVPSQCKVIVPIIDYAIIQRYRDEKNWNIEMAPLNEGLQITVKGKSTHASTPELGENAIVRALTLVSDIYNDPFAQNMAAFFSDYYGKGLNIESESSEMGPLTSNLGTILIHDGQVQLELDCRFPQTITSDEITTQLQEKLGKNFQISRLFDTPAILYDVNAPAVQMIQEKFKEKYPSHSQTPELKGGVTYSKVVPNCVAFGMAFENEPMLAHQADESVDLSNLADLLAFYTETLVTVANLPLL
ncbi:Sapep family Mn(2+)-dependent dipeptidase [Aerococcaceae bacterium DSM 111020]|nr:Sapep family Mn(2+)-dependent dipeptidase [Aerococcaceae bacterium DSM 111020]